MEAVDSRSQNFSGAEEQGGLCGTTSVPQDRPIKLPQSFVNNTVCLYRTRSKKFHTALILSYGAPRSFSMMNEHPRVLGWIYLAWCRYPAWIKLTEYQENEKASVMTTPLPHQP